MPYKLKLLIALFFLQSISLQAQKLKLPKPFGKKKGTTQWYGVPVKERKIKNNNNVYATVGFGGGSSNYYGDLTSYKYPVETILKMTRWNLSANYTKHFNHRFAARLALSYARILGDDDNFKSATGVYLDKYARGVHFRNDLKEFSLTGVYDFARYRSSSYNHRQKITPYLFGGIALANHNPRARAATSASGAVSKEWEKLREKDSEGLSGLGERQYPTIAFAIPFGAGFRFKLTDQLDFSIEGGIRKTFGRGGKYLDDVAGRYIPTASSNTIPTDAEKYSYRRNEVFSARTGNLRNLGIAPNINTQQSPGVGSPRGNGRQDWYLLTVFSLNYYIPAKIRCFPYQR
jgi:Domain of unknown function (DUF6089)